MFTKQAVGGGKTINLNTLRPPTLQAAKKPYKVNCTITYRILQQNISGKMRSLHMKAQLETTNRQSIRIPQHFAKNEMETHRVAHDNGSQKINGDEYR